MNIDNLSLKPNSYDIEKNEERFSGASKFVG